MSNDREKQISPAEERTATGRLDSWKEIAAYLGRDARTVQRWEKEEGLPVHRHAHKKLGTVYAFTEELNAWSRKRQVGPDPSTPASHFTPRSVWTAAVLVLIAAGAAVYFFRSRRQPPFEYPVLRQITTEPGLTWEPAISPKGDLVAYASDRGGDGNTSIWVQQTARGRAIRLTTADAGDSQPAFSPDGATIAFRSEREGGGVYTVPALGGEAKRIADRGRRPRYSPDGRWIAFWEGKRPDRFGSLYVIPAVGGQPKRLTAPSVNVRSPVWAPDSRHLLFLAWSASPRLEHDWYVTDLEGASLLPTGAAAAFRSAGLARRRRAPSLVDPDAWTTQTNEVIFSGDFGDTTNLWRMPISPQTWKVAGPPVRLTSGTGLELHGSASDAGVVVFSSVTQNADVWSLPLDPNQPKTAGEIVRVTQSAADDLSPSISADGMRLVFESLRTGKRQVWKQDLRTGSAAELVTTPSDEALPTISADGQMVAYAVANYENPAAVPNPDIYTIPFVGGQPRKLCGQCGLPFGWSPDSATLLYEDETAMGALDVRSASRHRILEDAGYMLWGGRFSPDGRWIAFSAASGPPYALQFEAFIAPFRGLQQRTGATDWIALGAPGVNWSPDARVLYTAARLDGSVCLWATRVDPTTKRRVSAPEPVYHFHRARLAFIEDPAWRGVSVGRNKIVLTLNEFTGNVWTATLPKRTN